ncbi:hypothetical protein AaE_013357 [Aphanomyces astaci]|uniref:Uncharacterized protein n=1 Tax=Aphanomyces astaci TaxID=112090 RepID=A0A6A4ZCH7_APHAT|nr:hypothetical protein AaE_013357 [Aphanomyces astaci]
MSNVFFSWLTPLLDLGNKRPLEFDDLYQLNVDDRSMKRVETGSAVVTAVYKSLVLAASARAKKSTGEITNLMSVDAQRFRTSPTTCMRSGTRCGVHNAQRLMVKDERSSRVRSLVDQSDQAPSMGTLVYEPRHAVSQQRAEQVRRTFTPARGQHGVQRCAIVGHSHVIFATFTWATRWTWTRDVLRLTSASRCSCPVSTLEAK